MEASTDNEPRCDRRVAKKLCRRSERSDGSALRPLRYSLLCWVKTVSKELLPRSSYHCQGSHLRSTPNVGSAYQVAAQLCCTPPGQ